MRLGIDLSPLCDTPVTGVGRALAHLLVGLGRTRREGDRLFGCSPSGRLPAFEGEALVELHDLSWAGHAPTPAAWRRAIAWDVAREPVDAFVSPWSAFPDLDVPTIVVVHELPFVRHGLVEGVRRMIAHRVWLRRDVAGAAAIVVPSTATRDDLLAIHPDAAPKVVTIPHGFDPTLWQRSSSHRRGPFPRGIVVGARTRRKGLDVFLEAADRLADLGVRWHLVGQPEPALQSAVAKRSSLAVERSPRDADLRALLFASDVLVYPSRSEGFGYPPLEAMAAGCPVVASDAGSIPEVCGDAAMLVPPNDPGVLAAAIRRVLTNPDVSADLVRRGHARCRAFPPETTGQRWWSLLRQVVEKGGG